MVKKHILSNDYARCANEACSKKLKCARYLDVLPDENYWYSTFKESDKCFKMIMKTEIKVMYVDYKVTTWNRVHFSDDADPKKIIKAIQEEGIYSIFDEDLGFKGQEILWEVDEEMTVEENNGCSTIEVYENNNPVGKLIWSNGKD